MVVCLPIVRFEGRKYFLDVRLRELRNITNPHDRVTLNDFELEYWKDKARQ